MTVQRKKLSSRVDAELLAALREIAKRDGRRLNAVLEDAMREYVAERKSRFADFNEWWPPHPTVRLAEGVSLRREDMYEERVWLPERAAFQPSDVSIQALHPGELPC